jgi:hypothetical protein
LIAKRDFKEECEDANLHTQKATILKEANFEKKLTNTILLSN